jgi:PAS domain S-box-containing protein
MAIQIERLKTELKSANRKLSDALDKNKALQKENNTLKKQYSEFENLRLTTEAQIQLINSANVLFSLVDKEYRYVIVNDEWCSVFGLKREDVVGKKISAILGKKEFDKEVKPRLDKVFKGKTIHYQHCIKDYYFDRYIYPYRKGRKIFGAFTSSINITKRIQAEETLRASEFRNRTLINAIPDMIFRINHKGYFLDFKSNEANKLYVKPEMFLGKHFREVLPQELSKKCSDVLKKARETGQMQTVEYQMVIRNNLFFFEARIELVPNSDEAIFIVRDITEQKIAEEKMRSSEEKYRSLFQNMLNGFAYCKVLYKNGKPVDYVYLDVNRAYEKLTNLDNVLGRKVSEVISGIQKTDPQWIKTCGKVASTGIPKVSEIYLNATKEWYSVALYSTRKEYFVLIFDVITERIKAEKEVALKNELLRLTSDMAKVGGWEFDTLTLKGTWTDEVAKIHDLDPAEATSVELGVSFYTQESRDRIEKAIQDAIKNAEPYDLELEMISAKGKKKWVRTIGVPVVENKKVVKIHGIFQDITSRKEVEQKLETERKRLRTLIETMPDIVLLKSTDGVYLLCNPEYEKYYGKKESELIGKTDYDFVEKATADKYKKIDNDVLKNSKIVAATEEIVYASDGHKAIVELIKTPISNSNGETIGILTIGRDITERKEIELKIENERKQLQTLIETIPDPIFLKDANGVYLLCNPAYEKLFEIKSQDVIGKTDYEIVPQKIAEQFRKNDLNTLKENKTTINFEEVTFINKKNKAYFESVKTPMYDAEGKLIGVLGIAREITNIINVNKALEESEAKLKEAQKIAKIGHWELDITANHLSWSDEIYHIFEIAPAKFKTSYEAFLNIIHPEDREKVDEEYTNSLKMKKPYDIVHRLLMKNGKIKFVNEKCYTEYDQNGNPIHSIGTVQDITEQMIIENALHESESRYRILFEQNPAPMLIYERGTLKILAVNEAFTQYYGYSVEDALDMILTDLYPAEEKEPIRKLAEGLRGYKDVGEWHHYRKDGSIRSIIARSNDLLFEGHNARVAVLTDVTERKIAEEKIKSMNIELEERVAERTEQLASVNRDLESFAYSISHDLRAPLRHIDGFTRLLKNNLMNENEEITRYCNKITESSTKMASMIDALLMFSRLGRKPLQVTKIDLNQLVNKVIKHFEPDIGNRRIEWKIGELPGLLGDFNLIQLVLENLISNAIKFTCKKETTVIEIGKYNGMDQSIGFYIKDNGAGFDMAYSNKLFGVFQRLHTKEEFEGTGIGLANIKQIINKHGGTIHAEGEVNKGATFYITFQGVKDD